MKKISIISLSDAFPKEISRALTLMGHYVYAYYRPDEFRPFYVGKGLGSRVLNHWSNAIKNPTKPHENEILKILKSGSLPVVKLLAYNLEEIEPEDVNLTVERALQDAFGIQRVWEKRGGVDRIVKHEAGLMQTREDSAKSPVLTLEAVIAKADVRKTFSLAEISNLLNAPVLMVGLTKTYHPSYSSTQMAEMARMYWALDKFKNTSLPLYSDAPAPVLLAWSSLLNNAPMIVGSWRVRPGTLKKEEGMERYIMEVSASDNMTVRKTCLGLRLTGNGNNWQGPHFAFPD